MIGTETTDSTEIDRIAMSMNLEDGGESSAWRNYRRAATFAFFGMKERRDAGAPKETSSRRFQGGLEWRYDVARHDGYPCRSTDRFPFIPNISNDSDAVLILRVYAELVRNENERLSDDLVRACDDPVNAQPQHLNAW